MQSLNFLTSRKEVKSLCLVTGLWKSRWSIYMCSGMEGTTQSYTGWTNGSASPGYLQHWKSSRYKWSESFLIFSSMWVLPVLCDTFNMAALSAQSLQSVTN